MYNEIVIKHYDENLRHFAQGHFKMYITFIFLFKMSILFTWITLWIRGSSIKKMKIIMFVINLHVFKTIVYNRALYHNIGNTTSNYNYNAF